MVIPSEIDNEDCRAALKLAASNPSLLRVPDPISMGALLWHDLIEVRMDQRRMDQMVHLTSKGRQLLKVWHPETHDR
jgi:hypothetical protein